MADGIVWNLASKALELLGKGAVRKAASWWGARDDLKKLENSMRMIQARVRDAERRQEDASSEAIKEWLRRLKLVLYQADDLFDEIITLDLQKQQMENNMLAKVGILFSKSGPLYYNIRLAKQIKSIRKELDAIKSDMAGLNLNVLSVQELPMARLLENRETSSFVIQEEVTGREDDKNNIIKMLLDPKKDGEQITVIPIVGFGGLGKTTLAQLVFNDERVQEHFDLTSWAYVPEINNKIVVMGKVYRALADQTNDNLSLQQIQQRIKETICSKKYLLVLDDIWDEGDDIKELLSLLKGEKHGSKVIVTTRSNVISEHFGPIEDAYKLGTLTHDQSRELFKKLAFKPGHEDNNPTFCEIGEQIVELCKNVPLVIKIIGGSLCSKHTTEEWLQVKNDLSRAQLANNNKIMAQLKLSYDYLPPKSKLCFAYCSLIPKGYKFEKDELVHLWMAQEYVEIDKGGHYFFDLVARNLLQVQKNATKYKMHDLLHDLAREVAGDESIILDNEHPNQIHHQFFHLNLQRSKSVPLLKDVSRLRSLLHNAYDGHNENFYSKLKSLRVFCLCVQPYKLPGSIGRLIHLRYLTLEGYQIRYLPNSITRLVNLQSLNLEFCGNLEELPRDFAKLVNLRRLLLPDSLTDLPPRFGKLTCLQQLNWFMVGKGNGIDSLPALNHNRELNIKFLRWRRDAIEEVKTTNLKKYHQLTSLKLYLDFKEEECTPDAAVGEMKEMLRCLELPPNLKHLIVWSYKGDELPVRWLDGLSQLVSIELFGFRECKVLPILSGLHHLKSLKLELLENLEYVEDEDMDNIKLGTANATRNNRCFFPSLEFLLLTSCHELKGWMRERRQLVFPCLLEMRVAMCPMLMSMPLAPKLEILDVDGSNWSIVESSKVRSNDDSEEEAAASISSAPPSSSSSTLSTSLKDLTIRRVDDLINLSIGSGSLCNLSTLEIESCPELRNMRFESPNSIRELEISSCSSLKNISEGLQHLCGLEELKIVNCGELELEEEEEEEEEEGKSSSGGWQVLSSLRELTLEGIPKMKTLPRGIACLTTLQQLEVRYMENLTEIPGDRGNLSLLCDLTIIECPKVNSLPPSIQGGLASLKSLAIVDCPDLGKKIMPDGEDWHLIQHIPSIEIYGDSKLYRRKDGKEYRADGSQ